MVIALLTIPASIAAQFVKELKPMMFWASVLGIVFTFIGLWLSYFFNLTSGATIIIISGLAYLISIILKALLSQIKRN